MTVGLEGGNEGGREEMNMRGHICVKIYHPLSLPPSTLSLHGREKLAIFFNGMKDGLGLLSTVHTESDL